MYRSKFGTALGIEVQGRHATGSVQPVPGGTRKRTMIPLLLVFVLAFGAIVAPAWAASLTDFGARGDGATDTTGPWAQAVKTVCASTERTLRLPVGRFVFLSPPAPVPCALNVIGEGPAVTALVRQYQGVEFLLWIGGQDLYGGGSLRDLTLDSGTATGGFALHVQAQAETDPLLTRNPHGLLIDNVFIGATDADAPNYGSWAYGVYLDGSLNASPPAGVPRGIRAVRFRNVNVSRFTILPYFVYYGFGTSMIGVDCYIPLGGAPSAVWAWHSATTFVLSASCSFIDVP